MTLSGQREKISLEKMGGVLIPLLVDDPLRV